MIVLDIMILKLSQQKYKTEWEGGHRVESSQKTLYLPVIIGVLLSKIHKKQSTKISRGQPFAGTLELNRCPICLSTYIMKKINTLSLNQMPHFNHSLWGKNIHVR